MVPRGAAGQAWGFQVGTRSRAGSGRTVPALGLQVGGHGGKRVRVRPRRNRPDTGEAAGAPASRGGVLGSSCAFLRLTAGARVTLCQADAPLRAGDLPSLRRPHSLWEATCCFPWSGVRGFLTDCFPLSSFRRPGQSVCGPGASVCPHKNVPQKRRSGWLVTRGCP